MPPKRRPYRVIKGSTTERFRQSRAKIRVLSGGFGNGKTTTCVMLALEVARDYPGCSILIARATYPKLNSTIRREFFKWCPAHWHKGLNKKDNEVELVNSSLVQFRYISQQGKEHESTTSNLLSATYDLIIVDQMEDPEITHKDFLDLMGRLRGNTEYVGNDTTMPRTGPRWLVMTANPSRNWVYRKLVKPVDDFNNGITHPDLLCKRLSGDDDQKGEMQLDANGRPQPIIEIYNSSTYENAQNLEPDFLEGLESAYTGDMRARFLLGKWVAYEGLVYPTFDAAIHVLAHTHVEEYYHKLRREGMLPVIREGYDDGIAVPCCYIFAFEDDFGNIFFMDGFYKTLSVEDGADAIHTIRATYFARPQPGADDLIVRADPSIFRRQRGDKRIIGQTVADMYDEQGVRMTRGNNDIMNGIIRVRSYLHVLRHHRHPITGNFGSPRLFISDRLHWWSDEITEYYWKKDTSGEPLDEPRDGNDHALDTTRYILTEAPIAPARVKIETAKPAHLTQWREQESRDAGDDRNHRHTSGVF